MKDSRIMLSNIYAIRILAPNPKETKTIRAMKINTRNQASGGDRRADGC
jgi:hypothetical protein